MRRGVTACALALFGLTGTWFGLTGQTAAQTAPPSPTVVAQPSTVNVPATRSASVPVTWIITNPTAEVTFLSVNSPNATMFAPGLNDGIVIPTPLLFGPVAPGQTIRLRETIVIPQSILTRVLQAGARTIGVERQFQLEIVTGQFATLEGSLEINLTGSLGAEVQISRIDLRFQNEAVQIIVPQYHPPEVRADITYTGTGLFRAMWEVADPRVTAAGGDPVFRVLRQERIRLGVGGFTRVKGPGLPADLTGLHIVRFRVLDGPLSGESTVVRYFVKAAAPDGEDWWKRYIRPHREGEGLVRVPVEPDEGEVEVEEVIEPEAEDTPGAEPADEAPSEEEDVTEEADGQTPEGDDGDEPEGDDAPDGEGAETDGDDDSSSG